MNLRARLARLEKSMAAAAAAPRACAVCGAPEGCAPSIRLVNDDGADLGPTCTACRFPLMAGGLAVSAMPLGHAGTRLILDRIPPG
ncbi:MAG: hypothetical protein IT436_12065 [Phycisphaerales bacterium]|nr:hypothetical protein [Phycisphaerales bacterium]